MTQDRTEAGQFAPKSETPRHVRSIRLTDATWEKLGFAADKRCITRADLIEQMAEDGLFDVESDDTLASPGVSTSRIEELIEQISSDPSITRGGKDKGAVRRGLQALLSHLL